ncbi:hypothetical protein [Oscillibacter sp. ER4]|uniref:hypothetical protein n=1 Tax=Oscillibacter sp. ER4 TaxID=1519439 RepID=UPI00051BE7C4|nr:hypothetical protein [Oscillibacter sp. ER4]
MPSNWLYIDTNFPSFTQKESVNDKVETMQDYLFMLVEQLRYTLHNLDLSNMNKTATDEFVKQITDPIYGEIKDAEGNITQVALVAEGLAARIGDAEGNITQLQATAQGLSASISNLNGSVTNLTADVNGIRATVSTKIDATQAQSIFDQSATGFTLGATSGENGTIFKLNYNGVQVASTGSIDLCVDAVNIYGTLTAGALRGGSVSLLAGDTPVGSMDLAYTGTGQVGVGLTATYGGMKMHAAGNIFLESELGPFALIGKDDASDYPVVSLGGGYLVLSGNYTFGASPPSHAPYGTVFFIEE